LQVQAKTLHPDGMCD